jgi:hypothetical protein
MPLRSPILLLLALGGLSMVPVMPSASSDSLPSIPSGLLQIDGRGGRVLRWEGLEDLTGPGAEWNGNGSVEMVYQPLSSGRGAYRVTWKDAEVYPMMASASALHLKPNRSYVISLLMYADFERPTEINVGIWNHAKGDYRGFLFDLNGIPNKTNGWHRWEWEFPSDIRCGENADARFYFQVYGFPKGSKLLLADVALIELPAKPLTPYAKGQGVTFRGGPGKLPMRIEDVAVCSDRIIVRTTGARYTFDLANGAIQAEQMLEHQRPVAVWRSSLPLRAMEVLSRTDRECVLANDDVTFGVQCDSLVMVAPQRPLRLTLQSRIGGRWNRFIGGHLLAIDDYGGIAVNPDIPLGSGRLARTQVLTDGLDFVGVENDIAFLSNAEPDWQIAWDIDPGERLALSVFPPRPFDWRESFHMNWALTFNGLDAGRYQEWAKWLNVVVLWDFCQRSWGMSFGPSWIPYDEVNLREHIAAIKQAGMRPINYMSAYFYYSRDPQEYIDNVRAFKERYGIEGVYSDGDPSPEWVVAYEEMRMLRELFPDGVIVLHTTGQPGNGGPPLSEPDLFIPAIDTYATATYRGEWVLYEGGLGWQYPRYISSQYRKANCIGIQKGDRWMSVSQLQQDMMNLRYNGRASHWPGIDPPDYFTLQYYPALMDLLTLWEKHGAEPDFFERWYAPRVNELTAALGKPEQPAQPQRTQPW